MFLKKIFKKIIIFFNNHGVILYSDKKYLEMLFELLFSKKLDLENPKTFNEKLQWLKLYDRKDIYTTMVDKYEVKKYVASIIGEKYIIPTIGIYNRFEEINFDELPNQFVIKCTHDSGGIAIVKDKKNIDLKKNKKKIKKCLKNNYYYNGREWPYKNVKPRIIIEQYMEDSKIKELRDYKFFCFNGVVNFFKVDFNRFTEHRANYYDINKNILPFGETICPPDFDQNINLPKSIDKMIELAEKLSKNIPFVRVDFYDVNDEIYFGEMTFYPASGFGKFEPDEWDLKIGNMLELPKEKIQDEK